MNYSISFNGLNSKMEDAQIICASDSSLLVKPAPNFARAIARKACNNPAFTEDQREDLYQIVECFLLESPQEIPPFLENEFVTWEEAV